MPSKSLTYRTAAMAAATDLVPIVLARISHPDLDEPLLLSSDPTERLGTDPLYYGTRHQGDEYLFTMMTAMLPDAPDDGPGGTALVFDNIDNAFSEFVGLTISPATVDLFEVTNLAPDIVEDEFTGLEITLLGINAQRLRADISYRPITQEPFPAGRKTYSRFRGLHP